MKSIVKRTKNYAGSICNLTIDLTGWTSEAQERFYQAAASRLRANRLEFDEKGLHRYNDKNRSTIALFFEVEKPRKAERLLNELVNEFLYEAKRNALAG